MVLTGRAKNKVSMMNKNSKMNYASGVVNRIGGRSYINNKIRKRASYKKSWRRFMGWANKQSNAVTGKYTDTPTLQMARIAFPTTGVNEMYAQCNKTSGGSFIDAGGNILCQFFTDHFLIAGIFAFGDTTIIGSDGIPTDKSKNYHMYEFRDQYSSLADLPEGFRVLEMRIKDTLTNKVITRYLSINRDAATNKVSGFFYPTYKQAVADKATMSNPAPAYDSEFSLKNGIHAAGQQYEFNIFPITFS